MANEVLQKDGTGFVWANSDYAPTNGAHNDWGIAYSATYDVDFIGLTTGQARMSIKADLGATRARQIAVWASIEMETDPAAGNTIDLYWCPSINSVAAEGNPGQVSGSDADYTGPTGGTLAEGLAELQFIGSMPMGVYNFPTDSSIHHGYVGRFSPAARYGCLILHNNTADTMEATDAIEHGVLFQPIVDEVQ